MTMTNTRHGRETRSITTRGLFGSESTARKREVGRVS